MPIVIGIDGTDASTEALHWSLKRAEKTGKRVVLVHAWDFHYGDEANSQVFDDEEAIQTAAAHRILEKAAATAAEIAPTVPVEMRAPRGPISQRLRDEARGASKLVVGSRGRGALTGMLFGSTSKEMATKAPCPVVIVPPRNKQLA